MVLEEERAPLSSEIKRLGVDFGSHARHVPTRFRLGRTPTETEPFVILFLMVPYGLNSGFIAVTLPYVLVGH